MARQLRVRASHLGAAAALSAAGFVHLRAWQAERRNPPAGQFADIDGVRVHYVERGVDRPVLFGHSFGALVALTYALSHASTLRGLVLASGYYFPTMRLDVPLMAAPAIPVIGELLRHTVSPLLGRLMWPGMIKLQFHPAPVPPYFSRFPVWMTLRPSQLRAAAQESAMLLPATMSLQDRYGGLEIAPVIVAGARDSFVNHERHSIRLSKIVPRSELILSPRAGHMVHHTDPRRVLEAIETAAR